MEKSHNILKIILIIPFLLFIAFLCFIFIGVAKVDAQSFSFVRPRVISISNNWEPTETTLTTCTDSLTCGSLTGTTGGNYTNLLYRINLNSEDPDISTLPVGNYSVSVKFTIRTTKYISASDIITNDMSLRFYTLTSTTYSKATCDEGVSIAASNFSDSSNRIEITYKCDKLINNRDDINFFGFTFYTDQPNTYAYVSSNLRLTDLREATNNDVIENNNANTQDIINNQNQNANDIMNNQDENTDKITQSQDKTTEAVKENTETNKSILEQIKALPQTLINGFLDMLKSLFIPSEEDLEDIINQSQKVSENFGFVGQSFSFIIEVFTSLVDVVQADGCIVLPALELKFGDILDIGDYTMWQEQNVCMSENEWFGKDTEAIDIIRTILTITAVTAFVSWAVTQLNEILSKEDTKT